MVELTSTEKEIQKLLKKEEGRKETVHLTPTEIKQIKGKGNLLKALKDPRYMRNRHVVFIYEAIVTFEAHHFYSFDSFHEDMSDYVGNLKFSGKWKIYKDF